MGPEELDPAVGTTAGSEMPGDSAPGYQSPFVSEPMQRAFVPMNPSPRRHGPMRPTEEKELVFIEPEPLITTSGPT